MTSTTMHLRGRYILKDEQQASNQTFSDPSQEEKRGASIYTLGVDNNRLEILLPSKKSMVSRVSRVIIVRVGQGRKS